MRNGIPSLINRSRSSSSCISSNSPLAQSIPSATRSANHIRCTSDSLKSCRGYSLTPAGLVPLARPGWRLKSAGFTRASRCGTWPCPAKPQRSDLPLPRFQPADLWGRRQRLLQTGHLLAAGQHLQAGAREVIADRLVAPAQAPRQEAMAPNDRVFSGRAKLCPSSECVQGLGQAPASTTTSTSMST
jgi:hypothetical protein